MNLRPKTRWLESTLLVLGVVLLATWSRSFFESRRFQAAESRRLEIALRGPRPGPHGSDADAAAFIGPPAPGEAQRARRTLTLGAGVLGRLEIPRLGIAAMVAEGTDTRTLRHAVGHVPSTALPGDPGNCSLAGHRDTFLRGLGKVRVDDTVRVVTLDRTFTYRVEWGMVVEPDRVDVLDSTATRSLTLITCYPFGFVGHAPQRFIVRARQVEAVASAVHGSADN